MTREFSVRPREDSIEHEPDEDCPCGPDLVPLPTSSGEVWWMYVHQALTAPEMRDPPRDQWIASMREWAAQQ